MKTCTGCQKRRAQLIEAKNKVLSLIPGYKKKWEIGLDMKTQNDIDKGPYVRNVSFNSVSRLRHGLASAAEGFVPLSVSNHRITKDAIDQSVISSSAIEGIDATRVIKK